MAIAGEQVLVSQDSVGFVEFYVSLGANSTITAVVAAGIVLCGILIIGVARYKGVSVVELVSSIKRAISGFGYRLLN